MTQVVSPNVWNSVGLSILANQHRYLASQNTERPVEKVYHIDYDILQYAMEKHLEQVDYISNVKMPFANQQITYMEFNK